MFAEIISIGDELLIGQTINTNAGWMGEVLNVAGFRVRRVLTISDNRDEILRNLDEACAHSDIVLLTGGLGPTKDDITKKTLADYFDDSLIFDQIAYDNIIELFGKYNRDVGELNRQQAYVPSTCIPIKNKQGTAPGMWFEKEGKVIVSMPGVPYEMKSMMTGFVIPELKKRFRTPSVVHKTILTQGIPESELAEKISEWEDALPDHIRLAYLPGAGMVKLRLSGVGEKEENIKEQIDTLFKDLEKYIPGEIIGPEDEKLEMVIGNLLRERGQTLCTAESCTGGTIAHLITSVAGSSDYFKGAVVAYANEIKQNLLDVKEKDLINHGAVSSQVVRQMAEGARQKFGTDYAIATSGIAGPGGGTDEKPVGTIWIAIATPGETLVKHYQFGDDRHRNITRTALTALNLMRKAMKD
ncbi:MAG: competence/damage-inducible protein A [Bacteroidales bacterium]|nr:competence/damage-inducible protein A [Bacteroidales bacterium]